MKHWVLDSGTDDSGQHLCDELGLSPLAARLLAARGLRDSASVENFLNPRLQDISNPEILPGMEYAVRRVFHAITNGESIAVFGDYDVDGITATALLATTLRGLGVREVITALPSRMLDGYGFSPAALQRHFPQKKPDLIITADCGISDVAAIQQAVRRGADVIVTDHHVASAMPADACASLNPQVSGPDSLKMLAGVGVAFKLCHALVKFARQKGMQLAHNFDLTQYLDWVALGTLGDVVPLHGENRIFVKRGLAELNRAPRPGINALLKQIGARRPVSSETAGFGLIPALNAMGRVASPEPALNLLLTECEHQAAILASELHQANLQRKRLESDVLHEARQQAMEYFDPKTTFAIVVAGHDWPIGVLGIVASRLTARFAMPAVVISWDAAGHGRGSARGITGFNLYRSLAECGQYLTEFGGHAQAAGLELEAEHFNEFRQIFATVAARELQGLDLRPEQKVHAWVDFSELDDQLLKLLGQMEPFGEGNQRPVLAARGLTLRDPPRVVGGKHLRLNLTDGTNDFPAIAFNMDEQSVPDGKMDAAFYFENNEFNGKSQAQLNIQDLRPSV